MREVLLIAAGVAAGAVFTLIVIVVWIRKGLRF